MVFLLTSLPSSPQYSGWHLESTMVRVALSWNNGLQDLQILHIVTFDYGAPLSTNVQRSTCVFIWVEWCYMRSCFRNILWIVLEYCHCVFHDLTAVLISDGVEKLQDLNTGYFFWVNCIILLQNYNLNCGLTWWSKIIL